MQEINNLFKEILSFHNSSAPNSRVCTGGFVGFCSVCKKPVFDVDKLILLPSSNNIFGKEVLVCSKKCGFEHYELIMYSFRDDFRGLNTLVDWSLKNKNLEDGEKND